MTLGLDESKVTRFDKSLSTIKRTDLFLFVVLFVLLFVGLCVVLFVVVC